MSWYNTTAVASFPGSIPYSQLSILHVEKIGEPGDAATTAVCNLGTFLLQLVYNIMIICNHEFLKWVGVCWNIHVYSVYTQRLMFRACNVMIGGRSQVMCSCQKGFPATLSFIIGQACEHQTSYHLWSLVYWARALDKLQVSPLIWNAIPEPSIERISFRFSLWGANLSQEMKHRLLE